MIKTARQPYFQIPSTMELPSKSAATAADSEMSAEISEIASSAEVYMNG